MDEESLITPEIQAMVGQEVVSRGVEEVSKCTIRRFAVSVGDLNPLYLDEEFAKKSRYGGVIAPPIYVTAVNHNALAETGEDGRLLGRIKLPPPLNRLTRGGNEYEFFQPVRPGDIINTKRTILDIYQKQGKAGGLVFVIYETAYTNQKDELLSVNRETLIFFE